MNKDKITEFKAFYSIEKEIAYINKKNKEGWKLVYIKGGCLYTFVRTQPDEYITEMHGVNIEEVSSVTSFAAQCGYESVPHTMDGIGNLIYFTGKKSVVPENFVSGTEDKYKTENQIYRAYRKGFIMHVVALVFLFICSGLLSVGFFADEINWFFGTIAIIYSGIFLLFSGLTVYLKILMAKSKNKLKKLQSEMGVFE